MDIKRAYLILELSTSASREEVENAYFKWIHRYRNDQESKIDIDEKTEAYSVIRDYLDNQELARKKESSPKSSFKQKLDHVMDYYKLHITAGITVFLLLIGLINSVIESRNERAYFDSLPPTDLSITIFGEFRDIETETLKDKVLALFPKWERVEVDLIYSPIEMRDNYDSGKHLQSVLSLMSNESDLFIVDPFHFDVMLEQGVFQPMSSAETSLEHAFSSESLLYKKLEDDLEDKLYGIDISSHEILEEIDIIRSNEGIMTIHTRSKDKENAIELIISLAES
ncbi:hypothetical protein [Shouchella shacheensis]|uniref:hypothetical protein n=1 Tax=Shouchella shacheensis TaxID=1649580 RepID=UPI00073FB4F3|nr:hypothetical protein [Shouchella shacheensis]